MQIGSKEISLRLEIRPTDRKIHRWDGPWLREWTYWKVHIIVLTVACLVSVIVAIKAYLGSLSPPSPFWVYLVMAGQACSIPKYLQFHKQALARRAEYRSLGI